MNRTHPAPNLAEHLATPSNQPRTEGIKYAGSKKRLLGPIVKVAKHLGVRRVLDGFAGTTRVSQALHQAQLQVTCNDLAVWSKIFGQCYLLNRQPRSYYEPLIKHLNELPGRHGWFSEHYGGSASTCSSRQSDGKKRIWQIHNTHKLDAIRPEINRIATNEVEHATLLASLMLAMDRVDNTVGHQASYLDKWSARSYLPLKLEVPCFLPATTEHRVECGDIFRLLPETDAELAYFDPPYGSANEKMPPSRVRYAAYYHLWTTICLNDQPAIGGAAGRRKDSSDTVAYSPFEEFRRNSAGEYIAVDAIKRLIFGTPCRYILLSYSDQGRASINGLLQAIDSLGMSRSVAGFSYRANVMKKMRWTNEWVDKMRGDPVEYLILISRTGPVPSLEDLVNQ